MCRNSQLGALLNKSFSNIERHNENLESVLSSIDFNRKVGSRPRSNDNIRELIVYFNGVSLTDNNLASPGIIGKTLQSLISKFADIAGKKGGEFSTPQELNHLMVRLVKPQPFQSVYDPCCGAAGTLLAAQEFVLATSSETIHCFGQELTGNTWSIAKMNMMLNGIENSDIRNEDTLINPSHINSEGELIKFDRIICQPPFSTNFGYGGTGNNAETVEFPERYKYGQVSSRGKKADLMFIQHMLAVCSDKGKIATTTPLGVLFRGGEEQSIRKGIVEDDILEAVISLPPGLFYGTGIPAALLVFNKDKKTERKNKILFIDASYDYSEKRYSNQLRLADIEKITTVYDNYANQDTYARLVDIGDIKANDFNLSVRRYVDNSPTLRRINELNKYHRVFNEYSFSPKSSNCAVISIGPPKEKSETNSIIISRSPQNKKIYLDVVRIENARNKAHFFEIAFDENIVLSRYAKLFFESELGRLVLSHLPQGTTIPLLSRANIEELRIFVPPKAEQLKIIELVNKLEVAQEQLVSYKKELVTKPAMAEEIKEQAEKIIFDLSTLSTEARVKTLLKINETKEIEFKQFFFLDYKQVYREQGKVSRNEKEQAKVTKNIASFLNADGGTLLIGVDDQGKPTGIDEEMKRLKITKIEKYFKDFENTVTNLLGDSVSKLIKLSFVVLEEKTIVVVDCTPSPEPVFMKGDNKKYQDFYIRRTAESESLHGYGMLNYIKMHFKK